MLATTLVPPVAVKNDTRSERLYWTGEEKGNAGVDATDRRNQTALEYAEREKNHDVAASSRHQL